MRYTFKTVLVLLVSLLAFQWEGAKAGAATLTLSGITSTDDNSLYSEKSTDNLGIYTQLRVGETGIAGGSRRSLLKFDISSLPANATISSVTVILKCIQLPTGGSDNNQEFHRVTNSWSEGTGNGFAGSGGQIVNGGSCWSYRQYPTVAWTSSGGDYVPAPSASTLVVETLGQYIWTGPGLAADVQFWRNNLSSNFGWLILGDETTGGKSIKVYGSSEDPVNAPVLIVEYSTSITGGGPTYVDNWMDFKD